MSNLRPVSFQPEHRSESTVQALMPDYRLEDLGPRAFEQIAVSLACAVFGADIEVYGTGRDRGREATWEGRYRGTLVWPGASSDTWEGYTVIQAKHKETDQGPSEGFEWLKLQIAAELRDWMENDKRRPVPRNLLFITNARLSADKGVDAIRPFIQSQLDKNYGIDDEHKRTLRGLGMVACAVWHRDKLNRLLDGNEQVRRAYPALLTAGDILAKIKTLPGDINPDDLAPQLIGHAQSALLSERWVRFSEASDTIQKQSIDRIIIDLPTAATMHSSMIAGMEGQITPVVSSAILDCVSRGNRNLRHSQWLGRTPRHIVLTGAPGNGKSTISSFITQAYRAQFIRPEHITAEAKNLLTLTRQALHRIDVPPPRTPRWAMRVELADMAAKMGPSGGPNLIRYLCDLVTERCDIELRPVALSRWLRGWPSILVFDGLDEVTNRQVRDRVLREIEEFIQRADLEDWDLLAVITTRPTGYTERFMPDDFQQIDLTYLEHDEALEYAKRVTQLRLADDQQHADLVLAHFREAARQESIARLILTPLQILMLTFILEQGDALAANRYQLFWGYYKAVFRREANKNTALRTFFQRYEEVIADVHARAGLVLHVACERSDEARPKLARTQLEQIARERLVDIGLTGDNTIDTAVRNLLDIAHTRLVLLVADEGDTVSFEVRSLQEVMASRALTSGSDAQIAANLRVAAPSPHWRNAWLFAAGRMFQEGDNHRDLVVDVVENLDSIEGGTGWLYPVAPSLAADMIQDDMAASMPRWLRRLAAVAARAASGPMPDDPHAIAQALGRAQTQDAAAGRSVREALRMAFSGGLQSSTVAQVLASYRTLPPIPGELGPRKALKLQDSWIGDTPPGATPFSVARPVLEALRRNGGDPLAPDESRVCEAIKECDYLRAVRTDDSWLVPAKDWAFHRPSPLLRAVVEDPETAWVLSVCLDDLDPSDWISRSLIAHAFYLEWFRRPVGGLLNVPYLWVDTMSDAV
jgi:hypothetical protein